MKVKVNEDACIGCGACLAVAPDVFEMNDNGLAYVAARQIGDDLEDAIMEAIETCPTGAIIKE